MKAVFAAQRSGDWRLRDDGRVEIGELVLEPGQFDMRIKTPEGVAAQPFDRGRGVVVLDISVTDELQAEGWARDVVRLIQNARKEADFELTDRISVAIQAHGPLQGRDRDASGHDRSATRWRSTSTPTSELPKDADGVTARYARRQRPAAHRGARPCGLRRRGRDRCRFHPSSVAPRHLLPQGEKGGRGLDHERLACDPGARRDAARLLAIDLLRRRRGARSRLPRRRSKPRPATVAAIVRKGEPVYGVNTGFGKLASVRIDAADLETLQRNIVLSHCAGVGDAAAGRRGAADDGAEAGQPGPGRLGGALVHHRRLWRPFSTRDLVPVDPGARARSAPRAILRRWPI